MEIYYIENDNWPELSNITLTIGNFDGVHLGHQKLIELALNEKDTKSAVLTLAPHPQTVFNRDKNFKTLFTTQQKLYNLLKYDLDYIFIAKFEESFYSLSIDEFIKRLQKLGVKKLILGRDFRFAKNGSGSVLDLKEHFDLVIVDDVIYNNIRVSTTQIKQTLKEGNINLVNELLGYNYYITGSVEHGNKIGKTLGFPTANIKYDNLLPKDGVYLVKIQIDGVYYYGISNIGNNPTVNYSEEKKFEVFILDYSNEIYNCNVTVQFLERLRDEMKFGSKEELIEQIKNDEKKARSIIKSYNMC